MIYSCNYKIEHQFSATNYDIIKYDILLDDEIIYSGKVGPYSLEEDVLTIDIAPICREYLETFYEEIISTASTSFNGNSPNKGKIRTINTFTVRSTSNLSGTDDTYTVKYDYNTDYVSGFNNTPSLFGELLNDPIYNKVDPRQYITTSGYTIGIDALITILKNGDDIYEQYYPNAGQYGLYGITPNNSTINAVEGDKLSFLLDTGGAGEGVEYEVVAPCANSFALYYVNKKGGLDTILMSGRSVEGWTSRKDVDMRKYNNRSNRLDFEKARIYQEIDHSWVLNTGILTDDGSEKIDNLIYSPKVFIHDLELNTITSVVINPRTVNVRQTRKHKNRDIPCQYTIQVTESQYQFRK